MNEHDRMTFTALKVGHLTTKDIDKALLTAPKADRTAGMRWVVVYSLHGSGYVKSLICSVSSERRWLNSRERQSAPPPRRACRLSRSARARLTTHRVAETARRRSAQEEMA